MNAWMTVNEAADHLKPEARGSLDVASAAIGHGARFAAVVDARGVLHAALETRSDRHHGALIAAGWQHEPQTRRYDLRREARKREPVLERAA